MASSAESSPEFQVTWSQKLTDFGVILKSGKELRVHKHVLAENSMVLEAMLSHEMEETLRSQMKMDHYNENTVVSFLQYLYSGTKDAKTRDLIGALIGRGKYIYKRCFEEEKLTVELLRMAHFYKVDDLQVTVASGSDTAPSPAMVRNL